MNSLTSTGVELLVRDALPHRRPAAVLPRTTGGGVTEVHEVRFADGGDPVIVKVYAECSRGNRAKEVHVYELLHAHGVQPLPAVLFSDETSPHVDGRACLVLTMLPGHTLSDVSDALTGAERYDLYCRLGSLLATVHEVPMAAFGYVTTGIRDPKASNLGYLTGSFAAKLREFAGLGGERALARAVERHVGERAEYFAGCRSAVLCHLDFHEGNLLVDREPDGGVRVSGLIDVENAVAGDPLMDLAKTDWYSVRGDVAKLRGLVDGYGGEAALGPFWAERWELYRLYQMLELWNWFSSIGRGARLAGIAEEMRALMLAAAPTVAA